MTIAPDDPRIRALHYAAETRRFEIERFWQRSLFFWGFIAAAFVGFTALSDPKYDPHLRQVMCAFGLVSSLAWTLQNRGSKYWQEAWESKVESLEEDVLGMRLWGRRESRQKKGFWGGWQYSVSRLTTLLSDITVVTWLALGFFAAGVDFDAEPDGVAIAIAAVAGLFCAMLFVLGRSRRDDNDAGAGEPSAAGGAEGARDAGQSDTPPSVAPTVRRAGPSKKPSRSRS
jgi:hypothetical protein